MCINFSSDSSVDSNFFLPYNYHNKAGKTANQQAGDISRRKKVKEKRPSPFLFAPS
jgi:hypothetical protein